MKSVNLTLANEIPRDKVARRVILPGVHFHVDIPKTHKIYDVCPPLRKIDRKMKMDPNFTDYTGVNFGRLKVIGPAEDYPKSYRIFAIATCEDDFEIHTEKRSCGGANCRWVVRCVCGNYEIRSSRVIKKSPSIDRCFVCNKVYQGRRSEFFRNHGRPPTLKEIE